MLYSMDLIAKIDSMAPAEAKVCPIDDFVAEIDGAFSIDQN